MGVNDLLGPSRVLMPLLPIGKGYLLKEIAILRDPRKAISATESMATNSPFVDHLCAAERR